MCIPKYFDTLCMLLVLDGFGMKTIHAKYFKVSLYVGVIKFNFDMFNQSLSKYALTWNWHSMTTYT